MKKIVSILLCLLISLSIVACEKKDFAQQNLDDKKDTSSTKESSADEKSPYAFISQQERLSWKNKIVTALSNANPYKEIEPGILGAALMDLNFDNTPELIVVGSGGSMGNGHMGHYYDNVYKLSENGFSQTLNAKYTERYEHIGNEEYNTYREYFIDDTPMSEAEYNNAVNSAFDISKAVRLDENAVSYDEIIGQIQNGNSKNR